MRSGDLGLKAAVAFSINFTVRQGCGKTSDSREAVGEKRTLQKPTVYASLVGARVFPWALGVLVSPRPRALQQEPGVSREDGRFGVPARPCSRRSTALLSTWACSGTSSRAPVLCRAPPFLLVRSLRRCAACCLISATFIRCSWKLKSRSCFLC